MGLIRSHGLSRGKLWKIRDMNENLLNSLATANEDYLLANRSHKTVIYCWC